MLTLSAFALAGACSPRSDGTTTTAAPHTTGVQVSTSLGATATGAPTTTGDGSTGDASTGSSTSSTGTGSTSAEAPSCEDTGPLKGGTCPIECGTTCEPSSAPWCDEVLGLYSPHLPPLYQDALRAQCERGEGACAVCFNGANLCSQLGGGAECKGLEQTCRCLADARGLL